MIEYRFLQMPGIDVFQSLHRGSVSMLGHAFSSHPGSSELCLSFNVCKASKLARWEFGSPKFFPVPVHNPGHAYGLLDLYEYVGVFHCTLWTCHSLAFPLTFLVNSPIVCPNYYLSFKQLILIIFKKHPQVKGSSHMVKFKSGQRNNCDWGIPGKH